MATLYADRVQETSTTSGTGTVTLAGAVAGFQAFTTAFSTGSQVAYCLVDGNNWEVGIGTFTTSGTTLSRDLVLASSNSGSKISLSGGTTTVFNELPGQFGMQTYTGYRNRLVNGDMRIDQRNAGASQTITAAAAGAYTVDRFYATCTGANVTGQQVAGSTPDQFKYRLTGAASVTGIAFGQRITATNIYDLTSTTARLSVKLANSLLTTVTWTAYFPGSTDVWTTRTQIATGTFTVNSTLSTYAVTIALGASITAGLEIELSVGAQTSGTWDITDMQLEAGFLTTPFERLPYEVQDWSCKFYYYKIKGNASGEQELGVTTVQSSTIIYTFWRYPRPMRIVPGAVNMTGTFTYTFVGGNNSASSVQVDVINQDGALLRLNGSGFTATNSGRAYIATNGSGVLEVDAELK